MRKINVLRLDMFTLYFKYIVYVNNNEKKRDQLESFIHINASFWRIKVMVIVHSHRYNEKSFVNPIQVFYFS